MNTPTVAHLYIYGIVFAVTAFVSVSIAVAQEIVNENILSESDTTAVAIADTETVNDEPEENRPDNQVQTGTPVTAIGIQTASDSGADDDITNDKTAPVIEFTKASAGTITARYRKSGAASWTTIQSTSISATGTSGTITLPNLTTDGDYEVEITQTISSVAGKATYTFTLDTASPIVYISQSPFKPQTPIRISENGDVNISLSNRAKLGTGSAFSADGNTLAVGASGVNTERGAVYLFEKSNGVWSQSLEISKNDGSTGKLNISLDEYSGFGTSVDLSADGTLLAVGAANSDSLRDAVHIFEKSGGIWSRVLEISDNDGGAGKLDVSVGNRDLFGASVAFNGDGTILAVGSSRKDSRKGGAYLFEKYHGVWSQSLEISDNNSGTGELDISLASNSFFGNSIAFSADGTLLAVGAFGVNGYRGAVYLFEKIGGTWSQNLEISDNDGSSGKLDISLGSNSFFGTSLSFSGNETILSVGRSGNFISRGSVYLFEKSSGTWLYDTEVSDSRSSRLGTSSDFSIDGTILVAGSPEENSQKGAVYLFSDTGIARTASVSATDNEQHGSTWEYMTTTGSSCGAAQFATTQTSYTEGDQISFSTEADAGKRVCFKTTDAAGNTAVYTLSDPVKTIDRTAPVLTATRIGTGNTRTYRVRATDAATPITGRTKDNVVTGSCTTGTDTTGATWSDYTPGEIVGTAHNTNGRCVIITDGVGNVAKQHLSDGDNTIPVDFSLDLDASGSFEPNRDAILLYLYTNQGASASELTTFTDAGTQLAVTSAIGRINEVKDNTNTPLDMDGNGTFTANTDGAIPYLHSGQGYDATALVPFTHDRQQTTATNAITRVRGAITPNWP